ncbi:hypothetical protein PTSG_11715 [Salpingoeca rosetta]|uniref:Uncharacterized protein n=1 Tax=Salpingoeca rosetta (strain ATCC 50818 / BSB-021) TaxID=946362 RepID=F2U053_SALR5|nr:uncharacterized protein PTSG_11715 [Salpingoeca rosetta]EGD80781.1 hypothetical protein PTSG_11715 [Salpingoeca rosetta]|eukprot:XP_004997342.1 hypothetical protein PTSG_11715 [Salpingoeca rosetta]
MVACRCWCLGLVIALACVAVTAATNVNNNNNNNNEAPSIEARNGSLVFLLSANGDATFKIANANQDNNNENNNNNNNDNDNSGYEEVSMRAMASQLAALTTQLTEELSTVRSQAESQARAVTSAATDALNATLQDELSRLRSALDHERQLRLQQDTAAQSLQVEVSSLRQEAAWLRTNLSDAEGEAARLSAEVARQNTALIGALEMVSNVRDEAEQRDAGLDSRITDVVNDIGDVSMATENVHTAVEGLTTQVDRVKPQVLWQTSSANTYSLRDIFDDLRRQGMSPGVYDCVLRTNNEAHWTGRRFTITVNLYVRTTNPNYPHIIKELIDINAGSSGCNGGLTSFSVSSSNTATFSFTPGNCVQKLTLACKPRWI